MVIDFHFQPEQKVKIVAFNLNYNGRVQRCIFDGGLHEIYLVEYVDDKGDIQVREFLSDELEIKS